VPGAAGGQVTSRAAPLLSASLDPVQEWQRSLDALDALTQSRVAFFRGSGTLSANQWAPPTSAMPAEFTPRLLALAASNERLAEAVQRLLASVERPVAASPYA
jgi:hypothetical protein